MIECKSCGASLAEEDRFCGNCGVQTEAGAPPPEPAPLISETAEQVPEPIAPAAMGNNSKTLLAVLFVGVTGVAAGGLMAFQSGWIGNATPEESAAFDGPTATAALDKDDSILAADSLVEAAELAAAEAASAIEEPALDAESNSSTATEIAAGMWSFSIEMTAVTALDGGIVNPTKSPFPIGPWETNRRCITDEEAENPRRHAFPTNPQSQCRVSSFTMAGGRYRAEMICNTGLQANSSMSFDGRYDRNSFQMDLSNIVPASALTGDNNDNQIVTSHFRFEGNRIGSC